MPNDSLRTAIECWICVLSGGTVGARYEEVRLKFPEVSEEDFEDALFELLMVGRINEPRPECYQHVADWCTPTDCRVCLNIRFVEWRDFELLPEDYLALS